jgi:hypothetical protein
MRKIHDLGRLAALAALVAVPLMVSSLSIAQAPPVCTENQILQYW